MRIKGSNSVTQVYVANGRQDGVCYCIVDDDHENENMTKIQGGPKK